MARTRKTNSRAKTARRKKRAMMIGLALLFLGGFAFLVTRPASTADGAGQLGARLPDRTRVCMLQDNVQAQAGLA